MSVYTKYLAYATMAAAYASSAQTTKRQNSKSLVNQIQANSLQKKPAPDYLGLISKLVDHNKFFQNKPRFEVNGFEVNGLNLKHATKKLKEYLVDYRISPYITFSELESKIANESINNK
jgi:hypothetical protein